MKILFVTHRYPPRTGGIETHVQEIATRLANRGHEVTVFSADAGSDVDNRSIDSDVRIRRFSSVSPNGAFYVAPQLALAVRRFDADIVHAHNYHGFPLFFAALGITDERFVVTTHYHGGSADRIRDQLLSFYHPFGQWAVRQADDVIAVSNWEHERLRVDFGVNATVIPNGLHVDRFANAKPEQRDSPYLLCVGRLKEYKGVQHMIRALCELNEYDLLVVGNGPYRNKLEHIAHKECVEDRVEFLGYVDDERIPRLYTGAEVYVTLSEFEAYGMTVAEALAAGTPCVVREAGALRDWTDTPGVSGVEEISRRVVASAINEVRTISPEVNIKTWREVTEEVTVQYRHHTKQR